MHHAILMVVGADGAPGASSLLLLDSAVKGAALLALAAAAAAALRRDSAATRHLVWLVAIVALLVAPALSAMLPRWRVLPAWAGLSPQQADVGVSPAPVVGVPIGGVAEPSRGGVMVEAAPKRIGHRPAAVYEASAGPAAARPPLAVPATPTMSQAGPESPRGGRNWVDLLSLAWALGLCILALRLVAARWILWRAERRSVVVAPVSEGGAFPRLATLADDPLVTALEAARSRLGVGRPVALLVHPGEVIPVVWGILRPRLLLPASARRWDAEQLRSVLLHELAHVRRHDAAAQLLAQLACALHWFNPLAWFAAWRLGVERERACDDLVLASGVRPSTYAGHLLGIVTGLSPGLSPRLSPARWVASCGLAMASKLPIEGRLAAVLSQNLNRRGVSMALAAVALAVAAGVAVPVAMLRAANGADQKPAAAGAPARSRLQESPPQKEKTHVTAKLDPETERWLRWGEPVNGLRAAIAVRPPPDAPKAGEAPDSYLVVQNVSHAPVRLADTTGGPERRYLKLKLDGKTQGVITSGDASGTDVALQPREVVFLPMFPSDQKNAQGRAAGSFLAEEILKDPRETWVGEFKVEKAPAGAWAGKLVTGEANGAAAAGKPQPKDKNARTLFNEWQRDARANGDLPGGLVGQLADQVKRFIQMNTGDKSGDPYAKKMAPLLPRLDASHDWKPADAAALMDDIAAVHTIPLDNMLDDMLMEHAIQKGAPLPANLADAPWGKQQPSGLRLAWLLEPRAAEYRLNTPLKSRVLIHNSGKEPVVFRTEDFHQGGHKARDANGAEIRVESTEWLTESRLMTYRLAPGEFVEVNAPGIGVGSIKDREAWQDTNIRVGSWVEAKAGDDVTFLPSPVGLVDGNEPPPPAGAPPASWPQFIAYRLARETPLPAAAEERTRLLDRVTHDLFGNAPTAEETAAFVADHGPDPLGALAKRLAARPGLAVSTGELKSAATKFHVLPANPDAAKKPRTAEASGAAAAGKPEPKDKSARTLFNQWQRDARANGDLPGGLVGQLADQVKRFIQMNTGDKSGDPYAKKMAPLLPRLDASHDWKPAEAAALMDDIAAVTPSTLDMMLVDMTVQNAIHKGAPLPANLADAPWGEAQPDGLRLAWMLEPRATEYRFNTPRKSRVMIHNSGKEPVVFRTETFLQGGHKAHDATGAEINIESTEWLTLSRLMTVRLAPGEFIEVHAPGIAVGAMKGSDDWDHAGVGSWVEAKAGDHVTFIPRTVPLEEGKETPPPAGTPPAWWEQFIAHRLARETPLPAAAEERTRLLDRVTHDLFGTAPTAEETAAFVADHGPDPLDALAKRLATRPGVATFTGELKSGVTKFHVLPADPDAAKKPRTANNPGQYNLRGGATLEVTRRPDGDRIVNEAHVAFSPSEPGKPVVRHEIKLPDGYGTWAAAWIRGGSLLWVQDKTGIRGYDITNPADVKETTFAMPADFEKVPKPVRDALRAVLDASGAPRPATATPR